MFAPKVARDTVLGLAHDIPLTHFGVKKMKSRVSRHYYWPGVFQDVAMCCGTCKTCQKSAKRRSKEKEKAPLIPLSVIDEPIKRLAIDMVGPSPKRKKEVIGMYWSWWNLLHYMLKPYLSGQWSLL